MSDVRIPTHIEVSGMIRAVGAAGGFGMVLSKGEPDAGTLMVICCHNGTKGRAYERMPSLDGGRIWTLSREQDPEKPQDFSEFYNRRGGQDPDMWIVELDHENATDYLTGSVQ